MTSVVSERGQITVPKEIRDCLGLAPGTELEMELVPGGFVVRKQVRTSTWRQLVGVINRSGSSDDIVTEMRGAADSVDHENSRR